MNFARNRKLEGHQKRFSDGRERGTARGYTETAAKRLKIIQKDCVIRLEGTMT